MSDRPAAQVLADEWQELTAAGLTEAEVHAATHALWATLKPAYANRHH